MPHESHLVQDRSRASVGKASAVSRDPPVEDSDSPQGQSSQRDPGFANMGQTGADYEYHHDDEEEDDKESVADPPPLDKIYARFSLSITDFHIHNLPQLCMFLLDVNLRTFSQLMTLLRQRSKILRSTPGLRC